MMKHNNIGIQKKLVENYWLEKISGTRMQDPFTSSDYPRVEWEGGKWEQEKLSFTVEPVIVEWVKTIANHNDMVEYIVYLSFYGLLLSKYYHQAEVLIAAPGVTSKPAEGNRDGFLWFKLDVPDSCTLKELLKKTRVEVFEAIGYGNFDDGALTPLLIRHQVNRQLPYRFGFSSGCVNRESSAFEKVNLQWRLNPGPGGEVTVEIRYNRDLFADYFIQQAADHYQHLLSHIHGSLDIVVENLQLLSPDERHRLLVEFNRTDAGYPADKTLVDLFEKQVRQGPNRTAVKADNRSLTYRHLNERSNRLASVLRDKGVTRGTVVALMTRRTTEMIEGILGILKAGGAYLPLDPNAVPERNLSLLKDCQPNVLLTQTSAVEHQSFAALQGIKGDGDKLQLKRSPPRPQITDFNKLPGPDRSLIDFEAYSRYISHAMVKHRITLQASRGCPFNCEYCHKIWPKKHVVRSAENIFAEVQLYYNMGFRRFAFIDDIFNLDVKNSTRFFELILKHKLKPHFFFPNGLRGDLLSKEYIDLMVEAGTVHIAMALETASPRLQKLIKKHVNLDKLWDNAQYLCEKYPHINTELFTMHGFPSETEKEALMTLDFLKSLHWVHFPSLSILQIYPGTDMERVALENGVSAEAIQRSIHLAYHELPETLPFDKSFTLTYQARFLGEYILDKERLLHVLPHQMKIMSEDEMVQKYNSFLPTEIRCFNDLLQLGKISQEELKAAGAGGFLPESAMAVPEANRKIRSHFPVHRSNPDALRVLLLDLSQYFRGEVDMLFDVVEPPLGLMYLMTYLHRELGPGVKGKIAKSRLDFDSFEELYQLIKAFKPRVIGMRTLSFYREFFHKSAALIRQWGFDGPIIAGGPYATSSCQTILEDPNINLVVMGEGELTFTEIIGKMIQKDGKWLEPEELEPIKGIVYVDNNGNGKAGASRRWTPEILMMDTFYHLPGKAVIPRPVSSPRDPAYIMYTSGSTGQPKGVMISHKNVVRLLFNEKNPFDFNNSDGWSMFHTYCFDFSVWEMYGALLYGGKLVVIAEEVARTPRAFLEVLEKEQVTVLNQVPTAFTYLAAEILKSKSKPPLKLRYVIFGGEALKPDLLADWHQQYPEVRLINMYGITETTVHVTYKEIGAEEIASGISNIGKPIPTMRCYILDPRGEPVPLGVVGEIVVGGEGVAAGYVNQPKLTAERFLAAKTREDTRISSFIIHHSSFRFLYRSGDLGKWLPGGDICFLGRKDNQVKIRGYRIECGEIEYHLRTCKFIKEALVVPVDIESGNAAALAAYYIPIRDAAPAADFNKKAAVDSQYLREYLLLRLPGYMVPGYFIRLDRFPLTAGGKIDKRALPHPESNDASRPVYAAAGNPTEAALVNIWEEVLGVEHIGIDDDFFSLGGDSIKGIRIVNKIQEWREETIHVAVLFEAPTVKELALKLETQGIKPGTQDAGAINETAVEQFYGSYPKLPPLEDVTEKNAKNPSAVFILCPPRSGSTLLRVILAGHPQLFAPPEPELMTFNNLKERKEALSGQYSFQAEGTIRAIMEIKQCDAGRAKAIMAEYENRDLPVKDFFREMQSWLEAAGGKRLVDKSPTNTLDMEALLRIEQFFEHPQYIHLVRHPYAVVDSFVKAKIRQLFRFSGDYADKELGELMYVVSHRNILEFFREIPPERKHVIKFEELVASPAEETADLCRSLGLEYHDRMIRVYTDREHRMVDGLHAESRMIGDVKFAQHRTIDARVADNWKKDHTDDFLGEPARQLAVGFGYLEFIKRPGKTAGYVKKIEPVPKADYYPLSHAQRRLWLMGQMETDQVAYNLPNAYIFTGTLKEKLFGRVLKTLVQRHESLRTLFIPVDGVPYQKILGSGDNGFQLETIDLRGEKDREQQAQALANDEVKRVFDLQKGPLVKAKLVRLEEKKYLFLWNMHHIIADGWSMGVLVNEILALYRAYAAGRESPLPPPGIRYKDYCAWQNQQLEGRQLKQLQDYWWAKFSGEIPVLLLPTDYPRPAVKTYTGASKGLVLEQDICSGLNDLGQKHSASLFIIVLAVVKALLYRYTGQEDIVVGSPAAGRDHAELEQLVGFFVNTLALRTRFQGNHSFEKLLERVKETTLGAFAHQLYPFDRLVEDLERERDTSRSPLFDVMVSFQNARVVKKTENRSGEVMPGIMVKPFHTDFLISKFDLTFTFKEIENSLLMGIEYNSDLFIPSRIERILGHFKEIARAVVTRGHTPIEEIEYLTAAEKHQLMVEFNRSETGYPADKTLPELFQTQAAKTPDNSAVEFEQDTLTYSVLNGKANQLTRQLRERGVTVGRIAAIMAESSPLLAVGILAILKAGGACLLIDPKNPQKRIQYFLKDANAVLLLNSMKAPVSRDTAGRLEVIHLDEAVGKTDSTGDTNPEIAARSPDMAYIIYSSGTTGKPKASRITHYNITRLVVNTGYIDIRSNEKVLQLVNYMFDVSMFDVFAPLLNGATLVLMDKSRVIEPGYLGNLLKTRAVSMLFFPTPLFNMMVENDMESLDGIRKILVGGEALSLTHTRQAVEQLGPGRIVNAYGPSENSIYTTSCTFDTLAGHTVPIGKPVSNTRVYILDKNLRPVPIGVIGELCTGGDGVAGGYLNRVKLTKEKFIESPFIRGERMYRIGDLACWRPDGTIEFFGRMDHQVKIRGYRIELGEIESHLAGHEEIKEAVVAAREEPGGNKYLCAYIVLNHADAFDRGASMAARLKKYLSASLPPYMIPAYFVRMDRIPLTANGKVDRRALPEPEAGSVDRKNRAAPLNEEQKKLAALWSELLAVDIDNIGIDDDFFELGGHSLKASLLVSKIHRVFSIRVPLVEIFKHPTINQLWLYIREAETDQWVSTGEMEQIYKKPAGDDHLLLLKEVKKAENNLFLVHDGTGGVEGYIEFCNHLDAGFRCWGIRAVRFEDYAPGNFTIEDAAKSYIEKIKKVQPAGPYRIAGWSLGGTIAFEMVRQLEQMGEKIVSLALIDSPPPQACTKNNVPVFTPEAKKNFIKEYLYNARAKYTPSNKIHTPVHYFAATESREIKKELWNTYCDRPINSYHVSGDHYSIFKMPQVIEFAGLFGTILIENGCHHDV